MLLVSPILMYRSLATVDRYFVVVDREAAFSSLLSLPPSLKRLFLQLQASPGDNS